MGEVIYLAQADKRPKYSGRKTSKIGKQLKLHIYHAKLKPNEKAALIIALKKGRQAFEKAALRKGFTITWVLNKKGKLEEIIINKSLNMVFAARDLLRKKTPSEFVKDPESCLIRVRQVGGKTIDQFQYEQESEAFDDKEAQEYLDTLKWQEECYDAPERCTVASRKYYAAKSVFWDLYDKKEKNMTQSDASCVKAYEQSRDTYDDDDDVHYKKTLNSFKSFPDQCSNTVFFTAAESVSKAAINYINACYVK